jgi:DNA-binding CsgD family transcriptional regulator
METASDSAAAAVESLDGANDTLRSERRQRVLALWLEGQSSPKIAARLGVATATVTNDLRIMGVRVAATGRGRTYRRLERRPRVVELAQAGATLREIAQALNTTIRTVQRDLLATDTSLERRRTKPQLRGAQLIERRERARELYEDCLDTEAVALKLDCDIQTVRRDLRALGLDISSAARASRRRHPDTEPRRCLGLTKDRKRCERIFTPRPDSVAQGYGQFCSRACARRHFWRPGSGLEGKEETVNGYYAPARRKLKLKLSPKPGRKPNATRRDFSVRGVNRSLSYEEVLRLIRERYEEKHESERKLVEALAVPLEGVTRPKTVSNRIVRIALGRSV